MNTEELKLRYGQEYPAAVVVNGIRLPLRSERRFSRSYFSKDDKIGSEISRFMDGSAAITAAELEREWPKWTEAERLDFCSACDGLSGQADFPQMLRFIMRHGGEDDWRSIALSVGCQLPRDEAFEELLRALRVIGKGATGNILQGIAATKHPQAQATLREKLAVIWTHSALWNDADFINWVAFDATTCITHLIELGAPVGDFEEQVRQLSQHVCADNRRSCRNFLGKYYSWLKQSG